MRFCCKWARRMSRTASLRVAYPRSLINSSNAVANFSSSEMVKRSIKTSNYIGDLSAGTFAAPQPIDLTLDASYFGPYCVAYRNSVNDNSQHIEAAQHPK